LHPKRGSKMNRKAARRCGFFVLGSGRELMVIFLITEKAETIYS